MRGPAARRSSTRRRRRPSRLPTTRRCPRTFASSTATSTCGGRACRRTSSCGTRLTIADPALLRRSTASSRWRRRSSPSPRPRARATTWCRAACTRGVLRAAAVAAALQADPDDRGHGPLRADLQVLPRRGPSRRPPARVHAGRRRDVVRAAGDDLRHHRAADARRVRASSAATIETPFRRMPYAEAMAKYGSDKPDLRCGMPIQDFREFFRESSFRVFREIVADGGTVRGFVVPKAAATPAAKWTASWIRRRRWVRPASSGRGAPTTATVTSSVMKALGEDAVRGVLDLAGVEAGGLLLVAAGRAGLDVEAARTAAAEHRQEGRPARTGHVRVPVGGGLPAARMGRRGQALRVDAPPVHVAARRRTREADHRARRRRAPRPTIWC